MVGAGLGELDRAGDDLAVGVRGRLRRLGAGGQSNEAGEQGFADHGLSPEASRPIAGDVPGLRLTPNPILIRIDTKSGHGASSTTKAIEQTADIYSFLMWNLGVTPK